MLSCLSKCAEEQSLNLQRIKLETAYSALSRFPGLR